MRALLLLLCAALLMGCGLSFKPKKKKDEPVRYPVVSYEFIQERSGGLQPSDHVALARWDETYYYFEWIRILEPATMKVKTGEGAVPIAEFDRKNGKPLERKIGIIGKEDTNGELFNAGQPT